MKKCPKKGTYTGYKASVSIKDSSQKVEMIPTRLLTGPSLWLSWHRDESSSTSKTRKQPASRLLIHFAASQKDAGLHTLVLEVLKKRQLTPGPDTAPK